MRRVILAVLLCCSVVMSGNAVLVRYNNQNEDKLPSDSSRYTVKVIFVVLITYIAGLGIGKVIKDRIVK
jgi:hypothetical protein